MDGTTQAELAEEGASLAARILAEVHRRVVGQEYMIERLLIGLLTGGHVLFEGVPGLAKTLTVRTLAETIDASFSRIQFTPDLLPADVVGTVIYNARTGEFTPHRGPVFANIVLADEINRAPAKVQAALLEAMQEQQVTVGGETYRPARALPGARHAEPHRAGGHLPAARGAGRPLHAEGRGRLPDAGGGEGDPAADVERRADPGGARWPRRRRSCARAAPSGRSTWTTRSATTSWTWWPPRATRARYGLAELAPLLEFGASPRATIALGACARAHAFLRGRAYVVPEDVKAIAPDVLRHRVITTYEAEAEEVTPDDVVRRVLARGSPTP